MKNIKASSAQYSLLPLAAILRSPGVTRVVAHWTKLLLAPFDTYRPEHHYMRGPGPKWRERHARWGLDERRE